MSRKTPSRQQSRTKKNSRRGGGAQTKNNKKLGKQTRSKHSAVKQSRTASTKKHSIPGAGANGEVEQTDDKPTLVLLFNKPFQVLCQFTDQENRDTLANYIDIPELYAAGRLDRDSEGLLLLTNNGMLQHRISHPNFKLPKTYLVQLEGDLSGKAIKQLCEGVKLNDGMTAPAEATRIDEPDWLWPRNPPIRFRKDIPTSWLKLTITEGRNRQVRRMTAAVGYPTLRLIRTHIGAHAINGLAPGKYREASSSLG